jgi:hypothetical protein
MKKILLLIIAPFLFCKPAFCKDSTKVVAIGIGYESILPVKQFSDLFTLKKLKNETEIQRGMGISAVVLLPHISIITPFINTVYFWHKSLTKDTVINSVTYIDKIKYHTVPVDVGAYVNLINGKRVNLRFLIELNYNFMSRESNISSLNQKTSLKMNNLGYSVGFNPNFSISGINKCEGIIGIAKKGKFNFFYASLFIALPIIKIF